LFLSKYSLYVHISKNIFVTKIAYLLGRHLGRFLVGIGQFFCPHGLVALNGGQISLTNDHCTIYASGELVKLRNGK
jgi:hypothetical protein